jgi:Undecaprenyl-phosphate galactose phosphotransferase WbaP
MKAATSPKIELDTCPLAPQKRLHRAVLSLLLTDVGALGWSAMMAFGIRRCFDLNLDWQLYVSLLPAVFLFPVAYITTDLYPGFGLGPVEELRRISYATSLVYVIVAAGSFMFKGGQDLSRGVFVIAWILSIVSVSLGRAALRKSLSAHNWWGYSVVIIGAGTTGQMVTEFLLKRPELGLRPIVMLDDDRRKWGSFQGVPVFGGTDRAASLARTYGLTYAILAMPGATRSVLLTILEKNAHAFRHVLLIPDLFGLSSLWVTTKDLDGVLGLELRERLLLPHCRIAKRAIDIVLVLSAGILLLPLFILIAIVIKLESEGPVFFGHARIGRFGKKFTAWKFRSMVKNADECLTQYLNQHPEMRASWERDQKLKNDPRLTRIGRLLRKSSLDELPQLINVLKGEMSLVGPRPIIESEIKRYGAHFRLYTKVLPGLTGLWQVSGRNNLTYTRRVELDSYYVLNWSVWLDIYILAVTIKVVLNGDGAY